MENAVVMLEYKELKSQLETMQKSQGTLDGKVTEILHLLGGTTMDRKSGLINKVEEHVEDTSAVEKRVKALEEFKSRMVWVAIGMGIPSTVGILQIADFFRKIFHT